MAVVQLGINREVSEEAIELSIIIPAYNEEQRLGRTLGHIRDYFARYQIEASQAEVIVVDDGSRDGTARIVREWAREIASLRLLSNGPNRGKGYSVRRGMMEARGRIALFTDADLSSPIEESHKLLAAIEGGNEVAIGSRAVDRSLILVRQSWFREVAGLIFNGFARLLMGLPFHDTQCGFKAFLLHPSRIVFEQQRVEGFGFDPEILFLAKHHGLRVVEVPVRCAHDPATKVHVFRDGFLMFADLFITRWNWLLGRYPKGVASASAPARRSGYRYSPDRSTGFSTPASHPFHRS
jgi:dolichyl-phosphate beta-glucosyltransferase